MKSFDTNSHKHFWIFLKAQHMFLKVNTHTAHTRSKDKHTTLKHMFACYTILFSSHYVHFLLLDCGLMRWTRENLDFCYFQCCASGMIYSGIRNDLFRNRIQLRLIRVPDPVLDSTPFIWNTIGNGKKITLKLSVHRIFLWN